MSERPSLFDMFMSPGSLSANDQEAMMPETFSNPAVRSILGEMVTLPKRAIESAGNYQPGSGNYDPSVPMEVAMSMVGGSGALPAKATLRSGLTLIQQAMFDGVRKMSARTPVQTAEEIWQRNRGSLKASLQELDRMRGPNMRDPDILPDLPLVDSLEAMIREKSTKPFVSAAKMDRIATAASDIKDNTGNVTLEMLRSRFPKESDALLSDALSRVSN